MMLLSSPHDKQMLIETAPRVQIIMTRMLVQKFYGQQVIMCQHEPTSFACLYKLHSLHPPGASLGILFHALHSCCFSIINTHSLISMVLFGLFVISTLN